MSVDIVSLVYEIDSTRVTAAESALESLAKAGDRVDASARKVAAAGGQMADGLKQSSTATQQVARSATDMASATGAYDRATQSATRSTAQWKSEQQLLLASQRELVAATRAWEAEQAAVERRLMALRASVDPLRASIAQTNKELADANALFARGAIAQDEYDRATRTLNTRLGALTEAHGKAATGARLQSYEATNLFAQITDIGVGLSSGQKIWTVAIQQGAQIVPIWQAAAARGVTLRAALAGLAAEAAPLLAVLGPIVAIGAVLFAGAALSARSLNKENADLVDSLGLTEKQLDRLTEKGTNLGVTIGDVFKGTFTYLRDEAGKALKPVGGQFDDLMDHITSGAYKGIKIYLGLWLAPFDVIMATWRQLPGALGDLAISAVNLTIKAVEGMVNRVIDMINSLITKANGAAKAVGLNLQLGHLDSASWGGIDNPFAGQAAATGQAAAGAWNKGMSDAAGFVDRTAAGLKDAITQATRDRIMNDAGDAGAAPKARTPTDQTDQRAADVARAVAAAEADQLQAVLALTKDVQARADIEKQVLATQLQEKQAATDKQIAEINAAVTAKRIDAKKAAELVAQLEGVKAAEGLTTALKQQLVDQQAAQQQARDAFELQTAQRESLIDLLSSQKDVAKYAFQRRAIDAEILKQQQAQQRVALEQVTIAHGNTETEVKIAQAKLAVLSAVQANEREAQSGGMQAAYSNVNDALNDAASAFKAKDWNRLTTSLVEAFGSFQNSTNKAAAALGAIQAIGGAIGGKTGSAISGAASGAMGGMSLVSSLAMAGTIIPGIGNVAGAVIGAGIGLIGSLFGSSKAKKQQKEQEAAQAAADAAAKAEQIATQRRQLEVQVMQLQGDATGALAAQRQTELAAMDDSNRALQQQVYDLQDAQAKRQLEIQLMQASGNVAGALAAQRQLELQGMTAELQVIQQQIYAAQDAQDIRQKEVELLEAQGDAAGALAAKRQLELAAMTPAIAAIQQQIYAYQDAAEAQAKWQQDHDAQVNDLRSQLTAAYNAESGALTDAIQKVTAFRDSVQDFQRSLSTGDLSGVGLGASYRAAASDFYATGALAKANDPTAQARVLQVEQTFLAASKASASDQIFYLRDLAAVKALNAQLVATADDQIDTAQAQLNGINATVAGLIDVNNSVKAIGTVADLAAALRAATSDTGPSTNDIAAAHANDMANGHSASAGTLTGADFGLTQDQINRFYATGLGGTNDPSSPLYATREQTAALTLNGYYQGQLDPGSGTVAALKAAGFARGGFHSGGLRIVGEDGPELEATGPSRIWSANQTAQMLSGDNSDVVEELAELRASFDELLAETRSVKASNERLTKTLNQFTTDGQNLNVKMAS